MISIDKLVQIGFTVSQATDISKFFRNVGYLAKFTTSDLTEGAIIPANKIFKIDTVGSLKTIFKSDTQFYKDIECLLTQKGNTKPNQSNLNQVVVYQAVGTDYGTEIDNFVKTNANWAQLVTDSRTAADIEKVATKALSNGRLFVAQTSNEDIANKESGNIAENLKKHNNENVLLTYHSEDEEPLACGLASIMAQNQLGSVGPLYSTVTNVAPKDYTSTVNANLDEQNITYYSQINPINGGDVSEYATPIVYGGYMINGTDAKRKYIMYAIDLLLKAKSIDFLKKKLGYENVSAQVLDSMLTSVLIELQRNNLIKKNTETQKGFELFVTPPSDLQETEPTLYNSETYKVSGYYRDNKTGRKVQINLYVDPTDTELNEFLGE